MSSQIQPHLSEAPIPAAFSTPTAAVVQTDAATLYSILSSIESLRNDVTTLTSSNESLRNDGKALLSSHEALASDMKILQDKLSVATAELLKLRGIGAAFSRFTKLPPEIQHKIWEMALTSPQTHIITENFCSKSKVNDVAMSCKAAWEKFKTLGIDFIFIENLLPGISPRETYRTITTCDRLDTYKNYVNLDIDTFWLKDSKKPRHPGCHIPLTVSLRPRTNDICAEFPIRTLAINPDAWINPGAAPGDFVSDGTIRTLVRCKVKELLIVVGEQPSMSTTVFTAAHPSLLPSLNKKILGAGVSDVTIPDTNDATRCREDLERRIVAAMHEIKDTQPNVRERHLGNSAFKN